MTQSRLLVVFDLDGVLVDFHPERRLARLEQLTGLAGEIIHRTIFTSDFEVRAEAGEWPTGEEYLAEFNRRLGSRLARAEWIEARREAIGLRRDVLELVSRIAPRADLAVLTNNGSLLLEAMPELAPELARCFGSRLHASCQFGIRKPDPEVFRRLLTRYGVEPEQSLFVDDAARNVAGAREAGMQALLFQGPESIPDIEAIILGTP